MAKEKKTLSQMTNTEKYKYYEKRVIISKVGSWVSILTPFIVIALVKFDDYFMQVDGWQVSLGCMLAAFVAGIAMLGEFKKNDKYKISGIIGWAVAFAITFLCRSLLNDLVMILGWALVGQLVSYGFQFYGKHNQVEADAYRELAREKPNDINEEPKKEEKEKEENIPTE